MHNPESVLENEMDKLLCDFEIQTDHLISGRRRPSQQEQKKKKKENCRIVAFVVPEDHRVEIKKAKTVINI